MEGAHRGHEGDGAVVEEVGAAPEADGGGGAEEADGGGGEFFQASF